MRILAIRGKNLASLRGEFELRLDQPPISSTNLFSISGPTGSGKSTLLDALCLALYGKTPRLSDEGGHAIGAPGEDEKLRLKSNDARALLSRGTADGFAQVDFQGADGKRCQATWRVHRAKNLGKFQPQTMSLMDLDSGDIISAQITEVRKSIETRIGFTFEEFKRTVLLPQFEFTNFLRAKPDDRAQILEHVMGGEVFSRLSKAAHERAASERDKLLRLQDKLGSIMPLSEEDRTQLDALTSTTDQALSEAKATAEKAGHDLDWHERQAVLAADLKSATSAFKEAEQRLANAGPLEKEVQAVSAAQPLRAVRDAVTRAAATQSKARTKLDETSSKLEQAGFALQKAGQALQEAESKLQITREQEATLRPEIDEARRLESQIEPACRIAVTARAECEKLSKLVEQDRGEIEELTRKIAEAEDERSQTEQWLATHLAEGQLSAEWPRWEAELRKHSALGQELATIAAKLATSEEDVAAVRRESGESAELASEAEEVFRAAQKSWEESEAAFGGRDLADLRARTSGLQDSLHKLEALAALAQQARAAQGASATARAQAEKFREAEDRSKLEAARLAGELDGCRLRIAEARQAVDATRAVLSFDEQRSLLKDGQACPLCGSPDHPYAHSDLSSTAIDLLEKRVRELEQLGRELQSACSTAETEQAVARTNACSNENTANDLDAQAKQAQHSYRAQAATLVPDLPESAAETAAALQARIEEVQRRHDQAASEEENVLHLASERDRAREGLDPARARWNSAVEKHAALMKNEMELTAVITRLAEDRTRLTQERDSIEALLNPVMSWHPDWAVTARQSANAFLETCRGRNQEFATRQQGIETTSEKLSTMRANLETGRALLGERQTNLEISTTALQDHENALTDLRMKRHGCLQGRAAADVDAELKTLIGDATSNFETARSVHTGLTTARALADEAEKTAIKNLLDADQEAASTELALAAALARSGIDRQKLEERLAHDETWIAEQRKHLNTLRESVTREEARREERQRILDHHSANDCPGVSYDLAQECAVNARAQAEDLGSKLIGLRAKQQQDDEVRLCHSSALADVRAQEESSRVWEQLDEVIGSADGKKFRVFAQSLAFEALVRDANAHLADLSPRYRLMSVPGAALELQVADQDLGSEVRTINSLSGGEVFLVSLALALGLSGISTRATQAQTLFIDEGFGTLDRDTLDHAMVALENLQATGRTVGIISHVPELQERFGAQVRVERAGCGKSRVVTVGP